MPADSNDSNKVVEVHFVPHSHMDAGWLKTYDEYFHKNVKKIFSSVIEQLSKDPQFTYTVGDMAFFRRYYTEECDEL